MTEDQPPLPETARDVTAADIYHREFKRVLTGGYSVHEVDEFLERVGDAFSALTGRLELLEDRDREQREQLEAFRRSEDTLRSALVASQKFNENILDAAKREANALREEAQLIKTRAEHEAARLPAEVAAEVDRLQKLRRRLRDDLLATLNTHRNLLESIPQAEVLPPAPEEDVEE